MDLLTPQEYPPDTPYEPYDDVSWALPLHFGVEAKRIDDAKVKDVPVVLLQAGFEVRGKVSGAGPVYLLKDTGQEALFALRNRLAAFKVEIAEKPFKSGAADYPAGSWILSDQKGLADALNRAAAELALDFESAAAAPDVARHESRLPRLAVWHTWADTEAAGWIRYALDREKIPYAYIRDDDIRAGRLRERYDVIVFPHNYLGLQDQIQGIDKKWSPMPYTKTKEFPNLGVPDASDDITGGIGWGGMANLEKYLADGGTAHHPRQRLDAAARRGTGPRRLSQAGRVLHPGLRAQGEVRAARPSARLRLPGDDLGLPDDAARLRYRRVGARRASSFSGARSSGPRTATNRPRTRPSRRTRRTRPRRRSSRCSSPARSRARTTSRAGRPSSTFRRARAASSPTTSSPIHRDLNRSDFRFLWNALLNWNALPPAAK